MCDERYCRHDVGELCSCDPVRSGNAVWMIFHLADRIMDVEWRLSYHDLKEIEPYQLCIIGKCRNCGGRLCLEQKPVGHLTTDDFLAAAYRCLHQFHQSIGQPMPRAEFRSKFVEMFRQEDRADVENWLAENPLVRPMGFASAGNIYTIVHTWADADQGEFPTPAGMASFTDEQEAQGELERLVAEEKENMEMTFSGEEYCEECGDAFWEAYRDGYAAGWFTRYEVVKSPLYQKEGA